MGNPIFLARDAACLQRDIDRLESAMREAVIMLRYDQRPSAQSVAALVRLKEALKEDGE